MARKYLGTPASNSNDLIRKSDLQSGWQGGMNWGRIDSTLYQTTGRGVIYTSGLATISPAANTLFAQPFFCTRKQTFTHIGLRITLALLSGSVKIAIYNDNSLIGQPGSLLLDCGVISLSLTGAKENTISVSLTNGLYWIVYNMNAIGAAITSEGGSALGQSLDSNFNVVTSLSRASTYSNVFGDETSNTWTPVSNQAAAIMWLRN